MMMVTQRLLVAGASSAARRTRAVCSGSASSSPSSSYAAAIAAATPDPAAAGADEAWPVVIVGGGPTGALLAGLLARMAVPALLLEKGASPARAGGGPTGGGGHPAAHFITARSMEALRDLPAADGTGRSVAAVVAAASPPLPQWRRFVYGPGAAARSPPWAVVDHFAASAPDPATPTPPVHPGVSPEPVAHLAQPRLVAALHAAAAAAATESGSGGELRYGAEVRADGLAALPPACGHATGPGALVTYHDTRSGRPTRVAARFVVAADGARSGLRSGSGVVMDGPAGVSHLVSIHFTSRAAGKALLAGGKGDRGPGAVGSPPAMLYFFFTPAAAGALVAHDLAAGEFVAQVPVFPPLQSGAALAADNAACAALARAALGFGSDGGGGGGGGGPDDLRVRDARPWAMSARVAASYAPAHAAAGLPLNSSLLLAGDAAHEMPPAGGFGMNTGLQDAAGLAPKLAAVLGGDGRPSLVTAAYGAERRPVAVALTSLSLTNWRAALAVPRAVGADDRAAAALASLAAGAARLAGTGPAAAALEAGLAAGRALTTSLGGQAGAAWRAGRARAALAAPGAGLRLLFEGADLGYSYGPGAGGGGQCALAGAAPGRSNAPPGPPFTDPSVYTPALVPGARFPAAAVRAVGGGRTGGSGGITSTIDLPAALASAAAVSASPSPSSRRRPLAVLVVDAGVAGPAATAAWVAAGEALASAGAPLATAVLAGEAQAGAPPPAALLLADDPAAPASATWAAVAGRSPTRPPALLVRPDGVVGWVAGEKGEAASAAAVAGGLAAVFGWGGGGGGGGYRPAWLRAF